MVKTSCSFYRLPLCTSSHRHMKFQYRRKKRNSCIFSLENSSCHQLLPEDQAHHWFESVLFTIAPPLVSAELPLGTRGGRRRGPWRRWTQSPSAGPRSKSSACEIHGARGGHHSKEILGNMQQRAKAIENAMALEHANILCKSSQLHFLILPYSRASIAEVEQQICIQKREACQRLLLWFHDLAQHAQLRSFG